MRINNWQLWLGFGVSLLLLLFLVYQLDLGEVRDALEQANYLYVVPAIGLYFLGVYFKALRWKYVLKPLRIFPVARLYPLVIIGYMANNLLPARLGELVRSYYLARREHFSASSAMATVAVERVYDGVTLLVFTLIAAPLLFALGEFDGVDGISRTVWVYVTVFTVTLFVGLLAGLTALSVTHRANRFADAMGLLVPGRLRPRFLHLIKSFFQGLTILSSPRRHLVLFLFSIPVWLLEGSMLLLVSYSFGIDEYFGSFGVLLLVIALVTATSNLATSIPSSIGGIGPFEVVGQQTLMALGVGASVAGTYIAFVHLVAFWLPINIVGLVLLWKQNISFRQLADIRTARDTQGETPSS